MTSRTSIALTAASLLLAALAIPAAADSSAKTKLIPAGQTAPRSAVMPSAAATGVNADAELNMIQIQSLVSQRQTAVQTTTGLIKAQNDATKSIINNLCSPNC